MSEQNAPINFQGLQGFAKFGVSLTTLATALLFAMGVSYYAGFWGYFGLSVTDVTIPFRTILIPSVSSCIFIYNAILTYSGLQYFLSVKNILSGVNTGSSEPSKVESVVLVIFAICTLGNIGLNIVYWNVSVMFTLLGGITAGIIVVLGMRAKTPDIRIVSIGFAIAICCAQASFDGWTQASKAGHEILWYKKNTQRSRNNTQRSSKIVMVSMSLNALYSQMTMRL